MTIILDLLENLAICDKCGETHFLDATTRDEAVEEIEFHGWKHDIPDKQRFKDGYHCGYTETYENDLCDTCASDEPSPRPVIKALPQRIRIPHDAFANDPHDEWPRNRIYVSLGLLPCGHPRGVIPCPACKREAETGQRYASV